MKNLKIRIGDQEFPFTWFHQDVLSDLSVKVEAAQMIYLKFIAKHQIEVDIEIITDYPTEPERKGKIDFVIDTFRYEKSGVISLNCRFEAPVLKKITGGTAFPTKPNAHTEPDTPGMSLLDYFAGKAMLALLHGGWYDIAGSMDQGASQSYEMAAVMLKEREKWN